MNRDKCSTCNGYGDKIVAADDIVISKLLRLTVRPRRRAKCTACDGSGHAPECASCNGYGTFDGLPDGKYVHGRWTYRNAPECRYCGGTGNARAKVAA